MAAVAVGSIGRLEELLKCGECQAAYTKPKILQCFHIYCQDCLSELVVQDDMGGHTLTCPACREVIPVPEEGVKSFQAAFRVNDLQAIHNTLRISWCSVHERKELELYCETCEELICLRCAYRGGQHHSHDHQDVDKAFVAFRDSIMPRLEASGRSLDSLLETVTKLSECEQPSVESSEHESVQYHNTVLNGLKAELSGAREKLTSLFKFVAVKTSHKKKVMLRKSKLLAGFLSVKKVVQSSTSKLEAPDPSLCHLKCQSVELTAPVVGKTAVIILDVVNFGGVPCPTLQLQTLQCVLLSEETGNQVECIVERTEKSGQCQISYHPAVGGAHQLSIKIDDQHVLGSPCLLSPVVIRRIVSRRRVPSSKKKVPVTWKVKNSTKSQVALRQAGLNSGQAGLSSGQAGLGSGQAGLSSVHARLGSQQRDVTLHQAGSSLVPGGLHSGKRTVLPYMPQDGEDCRRDNWFVCPDCGRLICRKCKRVHVLGGCVHLEHGVVCLDCEGVICPECGRVLGLISPNWRGVICPKCGGVLSRVVNCDDKHTHHGLHNGSPLGRVYNSVPPVVASVAVVVVLILLAAAFFVIYSYLRT